jgi:polyhydroxybutyrate depolymerase
VAFGEQRLRRGRPRRGARTANTLWLPVTAAGGVLLLLIWFALSRGSGSPGPDVPGATSAGAAAGAAAGPAGGGGGRPAALAAPTRAPIPRSGCETGRRIPAGTATAKINVGKATRDYHLAVPAGSRANAALPLVFNFHGPGQSPADLESYTHLAAGGLADGNVVVTPAGVAGRWNFVRSAAAGPDDVAFVEAVLNELTARMCLNPKRVFAVGYSDGADMAIAAACALSGRFAAVVAVAGSVLPAACPQPPSSVLEIHGTADPVAPYDGGGPPRPAPFDRVRAQPVEGRLGEIAARLGCAGPENWATTTAKAKWRVWKGCRGGGDVGLIKVVGGGHTWLGAKARPNLGPTVSDMSATEVALLYFVGHSASPAGPRRSPPSGAPAPSR